MEKKAFFKKTDGLPDSSLSGSMNNNVEENLKVSWYTHLFIVASGILLALSMGLSYLVSDQNVYLIYGLRLANPDFLPNDWFTWQTEHIHQLYSYLILLLSKLGSLPLMTALAYIAAMIIYTESIYFINRLLYKRPFLPFIISVSFLTIIANSVILSFGYLTPELTAYNLAGILFICGVTLLLYKRYLLSGIVIGLCGVMHANYMVIIPIALLPLLIIRFKDFTLKEVASWVVPFLLLTLPQVAYITLNFIIPSSGSISNEDFFIYIRSPHHHIPLTWGVKAYVSYFAMLLPGMIALKVRTPSQAAYKHLKIILASIAGMVVVSLLLTTVVFVKPVSKYLFYRSAPMILVFGLIFLSGAIAKLLENRNLLKEKILPVAGIVAGMLVTIFSIGPIQQGKMIIIIAACVIAILVGYIQYFRNEVLRFRVYTGIFTIYLILFALIGVAGSNIFTPKKYINDSLYGWIEQNTPNDALFVVPVYMQDFRIRAGRSIIIDWKAGVAKPDEIKEWIRRMVMVCGLKELTNSRDAYNGYNTLNSRRAKMLKQEFGADYLVIDRRRHTGKLGVEEKVLYMDDFYVVFKI